MSELRIRITDTERADLDSRAKERNLNRGDYVRALLFAPDRPVDERELHAMVAAKARGGNMRAIEILARSVTVTPSAPEAPAAQIDDPFAEVDELAERRRGRAV